MQDEDIQPNEEFLSTLASLLKRNNQPVPFVYKNDKVRDRVKPNAPYVEKFRTAVMNGDLVEAEIIVSKWVKLPEIFLSVFHHSNDYCLIFLTALVLPIQT